MQHAIELRHQIHRYPDLSGEEDDTARRIVEFFASRSPDEIVESLGGHGVAVVFSAVASGPTVLLRCELDALPIHETNEVDYRSSKDGVAHKCGHDGHMAILAAVGDALCRQPLGRGRVVLLFQPAEETGAGAAAVIADPRFAALRPDAAFALHNLPGVPFGQVVVRVGTMCCASRGMQIDLEGATAHAAQPETGVSPGRAMCRIIDELTGLPERLNLGDELAFATVVGARLGARAFGTAPADAEIYATLRSESDATMATMLAHCRDFVAAQAVRDSLKYAIDFEDIFPATVNSRAGVDAVIAAAQTEHLKIAERPFRWSEDFGHFTAAAGGALFGLGAGTGQPELHNADYDFPDALIEVGAALLERIARDWLRD